MIGTDAIFMIYDDIPLGKKRISFFEERPTFSASAMRCCVVTVPYIFRTVLVLTTATSTTNY